MCVLSLREQQKQEIVNSGHWYFNWTLWIKKNWKVAFLYSVIYIPICLEYGAMETKVCGTDCVIRRWNNRDGLGCGSTIDHPSHLPGLVTFWIMLHFNPGPKLTRVLCPLVLALQQGKETIKSILFFLIFWKIVISMIQFYKNSSLPQSPSSFPLPAISPITLR